jgi:predicted metal-dependent RNase
MLIDLPEKLANHFERVENLAIEAAGDSGDESFSSRAAAMTALSNIIKELTKTQTELHSSQAISNLQTAIVEALEDHDQEFKDNVIEILEKRLERL